LFHHFFGFAKWLLSLLQSATNFVELLFKDSLTTLCVTSANSIQLWSNRLKFGIGAPDGTVASY
jgi:hypothetical protein